MKSISKRDQQCEWMKKLILRKNFVKALCLKQKYFEQKRQKDLREITLHQKTEKKTGTNFFVKTLCIQQKDFEQKYKNSENTLQKKYCDERSIQKRIVTSLSIDFLNSFYFFGRLKIILVLKFTNWILEFFQEINFGASC